MNYLYLSLMTFTISFPLVRSFEHRIKYAKKWIALFPGMIITAAFFIIWDVIFTKNGVWGFSETYTLDLYIAYLPIEEWSFFFAVPFASVFIYECVLYFLPNIDTHKNLSLFTILLSVALIITALVFSNQAYTFWNFLFCGSFLLYVGFKNPAWLGKFYVTYLFHLIPFFLVNGVLTGSFIENEVVWYNNDENFGFRLFTIPVEDTIYSMLLLIMNVTFFEYFKKRFKVPT